MQTTRGAHRLSPWGALHPQIGFEVVTIHPLADDHALLAKLNMRPEDCTSCDMYWELPSIRGKPAATGVRETRMLGFVSIWCAQDELRTYTRRAKTSRPDNTTKS